MSKKEMKQDETFLYEALSMLNGTDEFYAFFRDLCTPQEIKSMGERWEIALQLGLGKKSYREIKKSTGASLSTIGRVGRFLKDEEYNGYNLLIDRIHKNLSKNKK